ncbi:MAG: c-type cytochrome [Vicinamibacteria bacterium]
MSLRAPVATAVLAFFWAGPAGSEPKPPTGAAGGELVFRAICASCHGKDARGGGPVAASLKEKPANLRLIAKRRNGSFPAAEIEGYVDGRNAPAAHGTREMPVWGESLAPAAPAEEREQRRKARIEEVVAYLKTIQE